MHQPVINSTPSRVLRIKYFESETFDKNFSKTDLKEAPYTARDNNEVNTVCTTSLSKRPYRTHVKISFFALYRKVLG